MSKTTPAQNALLKTLQDAGARGVPVSQCHSFTLAGLMRRGLATISFGTAYVRPDADRADGASAPSERSEPFTPPEAS